MVVRPWKNYIIKKVIKIFIGNLIVSFMISFFLIDEIYFNLFIDSMSFLRWSLIKTYYKNCLPKDVTIQ